MPAHESPLEDLFLSVIKKKKKRRRENGIKDIAAREFD